MKPDNIESRHSAPEETVSSAPGCSYQTYCDLDVKLSDDEDYFGDDDDISSQEALLASTNPSRSRSDLHPNEHLDHDR